MNLLLKYLLVFTAFCCVTLSTVAQTNISGVINNYIDVTAFNPGTNSVTVSSAAGFSVGDKVLLIQMQGATISETDDANFGTITNYNDAGNYEILVICDITGNEVTFDQLIMNNYTPSGVVQMISIPQYTNALISGGDLTCAPWDGTTGGVLILEASGTLDFGSQNINVNGLGFRGFQALITNGNCNAFAQDNSYYQPFTNQSVLSRKGEGIAAIIAGKETGRGPQANGGGGGNNHNNGGGGGGNYGAGGAGGRRVPRNAFTCGSPVGVNSKNLVAGYSTNKIFMGGASGAGNGNNAPETNEHGADGAGIVIIIANTIDGNNRSIIANGIDVGTASYDGAGGGSAGGTVLLDVANYTSNLTIDVSGGDGGDIFDTGTSNCNGPGGGGGGGVIWYSLGAAPGAVTANLNGGTAGQILNTGQGNCTVGSTNGALAGGVGGTLTNLSLNESTTPYTGCSLALPVGLMSFSGEQKDEVIQLEWQTYTEVNNDYFTVLRSEDGENYSEIGQVNGAGNSLTPKSYELTDYSLRTGTIYYRLKQTDFNGNYKFVGDLAFNIEQVIHELLVFPNPVQETANIRFVSSIQKDVLIEIFELTGKKSMSFTYNSVAGPNTISFETSSLASGTYLLVVSNGVEKYRSRFVK